jgi:hypothetical protein
MVKHAAGFLAAAVGLLPPASHAQQTGTLNIAATVLSKNTCKFSGNTPLALAFGTIDPSAAGPAVATATRSFSCNGSASLASFSITASNGSYYAGGSRRMRHQTLTTEFLEYSLSISPASGTVAKNVAQTMTVTGTITQSQYQNAYVGSYADVVTLTLSP